MEEELKEAGAGGYRFSATQGGEIAFGGRDSARGSAATRRRRSCRRRTHPSRAAEAREACSPWTVASLRSPRRRLSPSTTWTPRFFDSVDIPVLRGRGFPEENATGDRRVAVVSQSAAQKFWPGRNPIGRRIVNAEMGGPPLAVPPYRRFLGGRSRARPPCAGGRCRRRAAGSGGPATAPRRALHHPSTEGAVGPPAQAVARPVRLICSSSRLSRRDPDMGTGSPGISRPSRTTCSMSARTRSTPPHDRPSGAPMALGRSPGCAGGPSRF